MKYFSLIILFVLISCKVPTSKSVVVHKTKIDSLVTEKEVEEFVFKNTLIKNFTVMKAGDYKNDFNDDSSFCKTTADSLDIDKSFYKADFDRNGYTDLLVSGKDYGFRVFVIMNYAKNKFVTEYFYDHPFGDCSFYKIDSIENIPVINYYKIEREYNNYTTSKVNVNKKIITYHNGGFVEYNGMPKQHTISRIEYQTSPCLGACPEFNLVMKNGKGFLNAEYYNTNEERSFELKGKYSSTINPVQYKEITDLLNYIDFPNLMDNYSVNAFDLPGCSLEITYDNGETKLINDDGQYGTYGLIRVYKLLAELRFNQVWEKDMSRLILEMQAEK